MSLSPAEQGALLAVARIVVGRYGYAMTFERVHVVAIAISAAPPYSPPVTRAIAVDELGISTWPGGNPCTPADVAHALRTKLRLMR